MSRISLIFPLIPPSARALACLMLAMFVFATAGCAPGREPTWFSQIAFASDRPLVLNVAQVEVVSTFQASGQPPHRQFLLRHLGPRVGRLLRH
jgi:hypothetical protein